MPVSTPTSARSLSAQVNADRGCNTEGDAITDRRGPPIPARTNVALLARSLAGPPGNRFPVCRQLRGSDRDVVLRAGATFARLEQQTIAMDTRLNWTFSPALTLELYLQPLIASGNYSRYNVYAAPRTAQRLGVRSRFRHGGGDALIGYRAR